MTVWQPRYGERVLAVLPDGREIEGEYLWAVAADDGGRAHCVKFAGQARSWFRTVKQLTVTEPQAFGARVQDARAVRVVEGPSVAPCWATDGGGLLHWRELTPPIDVDPDWGDK